MYSTDKRRRNNGVSETHQMERGKPTTHQTALTHTSTQTRLLIRTHLLTPLLVFLKGEEGHLSLAVLLFRLYNRRSKLLEKAGVLEEVGPIVVEQIDQQALDMRAIGILHTHTQ